MAPLRSCVAGIAAAVLLVAVAPAWAQPIFAHADSLEQMAAVSSVIVVATITDNRGEPGKYHQTWETVTARVHETLKGKVSQSVTFVVQNPRDDTTLAEWKQNGARLLMFLVDSANRQHNAEKYRQQKLALYPRLLWTQACVELNGKGPAKLLTMDFQGLTDAKEILQKTRYAVEAVAQQAPIGGHTIRWPAGVPEGVVFSGSGLFLTVPVDSRLEAQARRWVRIEAGDSLSENTAPEVKRFFGTTPFHSQNARWAAGRFREEGVKALAHFRSDANAAILRGLAEDPASQVRTVEQGRGAAVQQREYPVRQAAKEVLDKWDMKTDGIVTQQQLLHKQAEPTEREAIAWVESMKCDVRYHPIDRPGKYRTVAQVHLGSASLHASAREAADLTRLAAPKNLEYLTATSLPVRDLTPLAGLKKLHSLTLWSTKVTDLTPLAGLQNLRSLGVGGPLRDISPLAELEGLEALDLGHTRVADLTPLAGMTALRFLDLAGTPVVDLKPLAGLTSLEDLNLRDSRVQDLTPLAGLNKLKQLNLEGTPVADLTGLEGLVSLELLDASETQVHDLKPLLQLRRLKWLDLDRTRVDDVAPLRQVKSLESVFLRHTATSDEEIREFRESLRSREAN